MKILAFLVAFLFCIAFVVVFIGSRTDNFSIKKMCSQLSSAFAIIAFLLSAYGGMSVTLSSIASTSEYKFKTVTNNEVRYFNECKKENGHNICRADSGGEVAVDDFWKNEEAK